MKIPGMLSLPTKMVCMWIPIKTKFSFNYRVMRDKINCICLLKFVLCALNKSALKVLVSSDKQG